MANIAPIDYWSYSSMSQLLRNPLAFKKKYILKIYDDISSPSAVVGQAGHKALEAYYNGSETHEAVGVGLEYINNLSDTGIDYGKTGSREKILTAYNQAINFYFEDMLTYHEILGVELGVTTKIETVDGKELPLAAKGYFDLVTRNALGEIEVIDHKFVRTYSDESVDSFSHFMQGMFAYHILKAHFGEAPKRIIFNECKTTKNKDSTPQIQPYVIEFDGAMGDFATFYKLYYDCTQFVTADSVLYLPNPGDMFDGQISFEVYRSGVIGSEAPVAVRHKTEQVAFTEKNYVPSAFDKVENAELSNEERIRLKLQEFGISVAMQETHTGASVIQYTLKPSKGVSMAKIAKLTDDIAIALEARSVRLETPIRGTSLVGVEVPATSRKTIELADQHLKPHSLNIPVGVDVYGKVHHKDISEMPHLLIAGATGSGKSVMLNTLITALTKQNTPDEMQLVLIDPKRVELAGFANVPHLALPIMYDNDEAVMAIDMLVDEMERRYNVLQQAGARGINDYKGKMPKIVIVIDEYADLMLTGGTEKRVTKVIDGYGPRGGEQSHNEEKPSIETQLVRIAQKARAVGIHLVLATQRPSADVVTGIIKANIPTKICFMTTNKTNSLIVLDQVGAEELTGKGDMLLLDPSAQGLQRLQGLYS